MDCVVALASLALGMLTLFFSLVFIGVKLDTTPLLFTLTLLDVRLSLETLVHGLSLLSPWLAPLVIVLVVDDAGGSVVDVVGVGVVGVPGG